MTEEEKEEEEEEKIEEKSNRLDWPWIPARRAPQGRDERERRCLFTISSTP